MFLTGCTARVGLGGALAQFEEAAASYDLCMAGPIQLWLEDDLRPELEAQIEALNDAGIEFCGWR